ncbi:hypothetical protein AB0J86_00670 [Micromonospora sp. NPDC049559]|uniref:hypothetical protein n=1 Tax=Micromonospora sp. NPDC049559 TaxID=3155923 RepID=UPI00343A6A73
MKIALLAMTAAAAVGTPAAAGTPVADPTMPPPVPSTPGARVRGVGQFTYDEPGVQGHRIRFSIRAKVAASGTTNGVLGYRHLLPDGQVLGEGYAEVTCVNVQQGTALVAAVVREGHGSVRNHGFYLKIVDGGERRPDHIETLQAQDGPTRPPRYCIDTAIDPTLKRYPIEHGGYQIRF